MNKIKKLTIDTIKRCFQFEKVLYTSHAKKEMMAEELGVIKDAEINDMVLSGIVIEDYPKSKPYPSCLIFGRTESNRPLHVVAAWDAEDDMVIVITVYEPAKVKWNDFVRRKHEVRDLS